jgi:hypothetical protein
MSNVKLFEGWLAETDETLMGVTTVWHKPIEADITKVVKNKKQNVVQVKSGGKVHNYSIVGVMVGGKKYDINFQKLEKTAGAGLNLYRYTEDGIEPYEVEFSELSVLLPKLAKGSSQEKIAGWIGDVYFTKI